VEKNLSLALSVGASLTPELSFTNHLLLARLWIFAVVVVTVNSLNIESLDQMCVCKIENLELTIHCTCIHPFNEY
jgi:hypothetical protein